MQVTMGAKNNFRRKTEFGVVELSIEEVVLLRLACVHVSLVNTNPWLV
jgi:hypothetical protein